MSWRDMLPASDGWVVGLEVLSQMALVAKPLLTNGAVVSTWWLVLLVTMFSDVMLLEVVSSVKAPHTRHEKPPD